MTFSEVSSSIVVRAEHQFNQNEQERHTLRKHFYELVASGDESDLRTSNPQDALALDCQPLYQQDRFGKYLGFLELRPQYTKSPIAMGLLAPPRRYRHDADVFLISANYGPLFGGPNFASTIYSMHDPKTGGAYCAQACLIMALGFLSDRGAKITGTYTLTYVAKSDFTEKIETLNHSCLSSRSLPSFVAQGLNPREMKKALQTCGVNAKIFDSPINPNLQDEGTELQLRIVEAYLLARFPVILLVESGSWWPWEKKAAGIGHAVTVIGFRRGRTAKDFSLIVHDPGFIPFYERSFAECVAASRALKLDKSFSCILISDSGIKHHAQECLAKLLLSADSQIIQGLLHGNIQFGSSYDVRLVHSDELVDFFLDRNLYPLDAVVRQRKKELTKYLGEKIKRSRYWCLTGFISGKPKISWLLDAENGSAPELAVRFNFNDRVLVSLPKPDGALEPRIF